METQGSKLRACFPVLSHVLSHETWVLGNTNSDPLNIFKTLLIRIGWFSLRSTRKSPSAFIQTFISLCCTFHRGHVVTCYFYFSLIIIVVRWPWSHNNGKLTWQVSCLLLYKPDIFLNPFGVLAWLFYPSRLSGMGWGRSGHRKKQLAVRRLCWLRGTSGPKWLSDGKRANPPSFSV